MQFICSVTIFSALVHRNYRTAIVWPRDAGEQSRNLEHYWYGIYELHRQYRNTRSEVVFEINDSNGELTVFRSAENPGCLTMNFPQHKLLRLPLLTWKDEFRPNDFEQGVTPLAVTHDLLQLATGDHRPAAMVYVVKYKILLIVLEDITRATFESITVPVEQLKKFDPDGQFLSGIILTVKGTIEGGFVDERGLPYDFASRYFPPWLGISEDPATGSAHCCLGPFWKTVLGKNHLYARQCFPSRGADFRLELPDQERIHLTGQAVTVFKGELIL